MKILITGGSGFLGSALAHHFSGAGHDVFLLLRPGSKLTRLQNIVDKVQIERCAGDEEISAFIARVAPDAVMHAACAYGRAGESHVAVADANVRFGLVVLEALLGNARPVVFINTATVLPPTLGFYALTKHQFADCAAAVAAASAGNIKVIDVRLQHMYGAGDDATKFTTYVMQACRRGDPEIRLTAGEQIRDFIYIDDVVSAYAVILAAAGELAGGAVELGSGMPCSVREFAETAHRLTRSASVLQFGALPYRAEEVMHCVADTEVLRGLGWAPAFDPETGIEQTIKQECWN